MLPFTELTAAPELVVSSEQKLTVSGFGANGFESQLYNAKRGADYEKPVRDEGLDGPEWQDLGPAQERAVTEEKKIMIFFEAEWCGICRRLESEVFSNQTVLRKLHGSYIPVMIDVDSKSPVLFNGEELSVRRFAQQNNILTVPTLLFVDEAGNVMAHQAGFIPAERMKALLDFVDSEAFGRQSFEEFLDSL